jgi:hypothetical protein
MTDATDPQPTRDPLQLHAPYTDPFDWLEERGWLAFGGLVALAIGLLVVGAVIGASIAWAVRL